MRVLVEARDDPRAGPILDGLARAAARLGHEAGRWRPGDPFAGAGRVIAWNGLTPDYADLRTAALVGTVRVLWAELGWLPHDSTFQIDPRGVNALASWADEPLACDGDKTLRLRDGDLLVLLQWDGDQQIRRLSPWFPDMAAWLRHLRVHARTLPVRVRRHPAFEPGAAVERIVERSLGWAWDGSEALAEALDAARAVATINSSGGVEALARGLPLLCYGRAVYRHWPAAWPMTAEPGLTEVAMDALAAAECDLDAAGQAAMVERIFGHQWRLDDLPWRLAPLLAPD